MIKYMLDTNICIFAIKHKPESLVNRIEQCIPGEICISSITFAELLHGVEKSRAVERNRLALLLFLSKITILDFDSEAADEYGKLRADLEVQRTPIGPMDMLIAGLRNQSVGSWLTNSTREFKRFPGLEIQDWTE